MTIDYESDSLMSMNDNNKDDLDSIEVPDVEGGRDLSKTRTGIMMRLAIPVDKSIRDQGLDMNDVDTCRRFFRAMVHLGMKKALDIGVTPDEIVCQMIDALNNEIDDRDRLNEPLQTVVVQDGGVKN